MRDLFTTVIILAFLGCSAASAAIIPGHIFSQMNFDEFEKSYGGTTVNGCKNTPYGRACYCTKTDF